jgi:hypothetical protein
LQDYETNFEDYKITPDGDAPDIKLYKNDKQGVRLTVQEFYNEKYITSIYLYPPKTKRK